METNQPVSHTQWVKDKLDKQEAINMSDFATGFKFFCEEDADEVFTTLLSSSFIPQRTSAVLLEKYH
ncbi:MAG: hypothetical protein J3Q66DRAFT_437815, partial [Benniella sp.]